MPIVVRKDYALMDIDDEGFLSLMEDDGSEKNDLKMPTDDIGKTLQTAFDAGKDLMVSIISAMGEDRVVSFKEDMGKCVSPPTPACLCWILTLSLTLSPPRQLA